MGALDDVANAAGYLARDLSAFVSHGSSGKVISI